ncbi:hypothetical protein pdam_00023350 [Pocillopora damicornis]|uniref:Endonuclease/exonuclease/phosphatase domain-containing protein n=1 Tax=Pocillopora damicornis TaxID=46731 RepID=A0A3M6TF36_POCDA|nr:hypothetical protein pdam_00023350 [Pocillopora damicornis]
MSARASSRVSVIKVYVAYNGATLWNSLPCDIRNTESLGESVDELRVLLQNNSLDLLAINETRLKETIADNEIIISGSDIIRRHFNRDSFRPDILAQLWDDLKRVHKMWLKWRTLFLEVSHVHAPLRSKRVHGSKGPWITTELKKMMHLRDRLKVKAIRSGDPNDWNDFKRAHNNVNNAIKNAKKSYYMKSFTACDSNSPTINELELEGKKLTDRTEIVEGCNKFFAKIGPKLSKNIEDTDTCFDEFVNQFILGSFSFQQISPSLVSSHLRVHINGNLSWECHINEISKKIASGISAIKRIRYFLPFDTLLKVYNLLGNCSKNLSSKLQKLQNRAAHVLTFSNYDCSTSELFQNLKWSKLVHSA